MKRSLSILLVLMMVLSLLVPTAALAEEMLLPDISAFAGDALTVGETADYEYCIQQTYTGSAENIQAVADAYIQLLKEKYDLLPTFSYTANVDDAYPRYDQGFIIKTAPDGFEVFTMNDSIYGYSANNCHLFICYTQLADSDENFLQISYSSSFTYTDTGDRLVGDRVLMDAPEPTAAADVPQGYHTFVEPAVEKAVRKALGKETGEISYEELLGVTELDVNNGDMANLEDIQYMTNLTRLKLRGDEISDISPLANLTNLTALDLHFTKPEDLLPLTMLTNLTELNLYATEISDISPLATMTNLTVLDLGGNHICDLSPLAGLTNLDHLYLEGNQISDISPLAGLTNLTVLFLWGNQISDLSPLVGLTNLTTLYLFENKISDLSPLAGLTNLTILDLWNNQISDLSPLVGLTNLTELNLWKNKISDLSPLAGLTNLRTLNLKGNKITDFSPIDSLELETLKIDEPATTIPKPTPTPAPAATPNPYQAPIVGNDGLLVMSPEEFSSNIKPCYSISTENNFYLRQHKDCGQEYRDKGDNTEWAKFEKYVDALVDSGYYEVTHHLQDFAENTWYLKYVGDKRIHRTMGHDAAIVVRSLLGEVFLYYSLDVITNDLEDTQRRLNVYIFDPTPDDDKHKEQKRCMACGASGKCSSCHGKGEVKKHVAGTTDYIYQDCLTCNGDGKCNSCGGDGWR